MANNRFVSSRPCGWSKEADDVYLITDSDIQFHNSLRRCELVRPHGPDSCIWLKSDLCDGNISSVVCRVRPPCISKHILNGSHATAVFVYQKVDFTVCQIIGNVLGCDKVNCPHASTSQFRVCGWNENEESRSV